VIRSGPGNDVVAEQTDDGQAAAAALLQEAIERATAAGAPVIRLVSKPTLSTANSTYERLGFTRDGPGLYHRVSQQ
jgi:ribosomal protein S18 acetylase RimI-like enzyme